MAASMVMIPAVTRSLAAAGQRIFDRQTAAFFQDDAFTLEAWPSAEDLLRAVSCSRSLKLAVDDPPG